MEKSQGRGNAKWVLALLVPLLMFIFPFQQAVEGAVQHQVGGPPGWTLPSRANVNYTTWAGTQTFTVGDTLYFNYSSAYHNVVEVTEANYDKCNASSPIELWDDGATIIPLNNTGTLYYICGIPTHCDLGQKVAVLVKAATSNSTSIQAPITTSPTSTSPLSLSTITLSSLCTLLALTLIGCT